MMAAAFLKLAQRIAQLAQFGFASLNGSEALGSLGRNFDGFRFGFSGTRTLFLDRGFGVMIFLRLRRQLVFVVGNISLTRIDQLHQFRIAGGHRLPLSI